MTPQEPPAGKRQRIAKAMARAGLCSRRDAEAWIVEGRVSVNGDVISSPALDIGEGDQVLVDGAPLPKAERTRLFLFHKPRGLVTTDHDPEGRETVAAFLAENWPEGPRTVTVGRLDINTEGLLLLTNDGGLARVLELPKTGWLRRYRVRAKGIADPAALEALIEGVTIDGIEYAGIEAKLDRVQGANSWLTMGLREGKNREIKKVLEHLGLEVNRLIRLSFGPFQLGDLPEGAVEEVRARVLRDQLGPSLAAEAGIDLGEARPEGKTIEAVETHRPEGPPRRRDDAEGSRLRDPSKRKAPDRRMPDRRSSDARGADRRRDDRAEAPAPRRERPLAGVRKHVSALRAAEAGAAATGPRRRIERADTRDRHDRTVSVERLVSTKPPTREARERPRRHESPAALGKRQRVARSGGPGERPSDGGRSDSRRRADRRSDDRRDGEAPARRPSRGADHRGPREDRREAREPRREGQRSERPRGEAPRREGPGRKERTREGATHGDARRAAGQRDDSRRESRTPRHDDRRDPRRAQEGGGRADRKPGGRPEAPRSDAPRGSGAPRRARQDAGKPAGPGKPRASKPRDSRPRASKPRPDKPRR